MDSAFETALAAKIDGKTKPPGSLGTLEILAAQLARTQGSLEPSIETCALTIFAADHGIAESGVSAFPQEVTRQMVANFLAGGAAANVFANTMAIPVTIVDAGVKGPPISDDALINARVAEGTMNSLYNPAMSEAQLADALDRGRRFGAQQQTDVCCFGEMGIGNTSAATLVSAKILGEDAGALAGRGTGLDDAGLKHKQRILDQAAERTTAKLPAIEALRQYGGFEIAMIAGAMIGAAESNRVVLVDGFIASVAALCAREIESACALYQVFAHRSAEVGHERVLGALGAQPLLDLKLRLGEGTGALLAWPLLRASAAFLKDMASFEDAGVSNRE
ncbi:MAG: nicotinate-nucleotide--dimethylbenzimidazole phosphoribosyltransferase [Pseudomonadota bacterium]